MAVTLADIERARERIADHLRVTPLVESRWLSDAATAEVRLKLESTQVSSSFKVRGAAGQASLPATIFTPRAAPESKLEAIRRSGADLRAECNDYEDAERRAVAFARDHGATFISAYNHEDVIAGGGTVGLEILEAWPDVSTVIVPVGGGGLISGIAIAVKAMRRSSASRPNHPPHSRPRGRQDASCQSTSSRRLPMALAATSNPTR